MERLQKNEDFQSVYRSGKSYANKYFIIYVSNNRLNTNRLGVSVSKKIGNSVIRHRMKRLVKESFRLQKDMFNSGLDIVVIVRKGAEVLTFQQVTDALLHLMKLHHCMKSETNL
jgi:ribonuclease P protein component